MYNGNFTQLFKVTPTGDILVEHPTENRYVYWKDLLEVQKRHIVDIYFIQSLMNSVNCALLELDCTIADKDTLEITKELFTEYSWVVNKALIRSNNRESPYVKTLTDKYKELTSNNPFFSNCVEMDHFDKAKDDEKRVNKKLRDLNEEYYELREKRKEAIDKSLKLYDRYIDDSGDLPKIREHIKKNIEYKLEWDMKKTKKDEKIDFSELG